VLGFHFGEHSVVMFVLVLNEKRTNMGADEGIGSRGHRKRRNGLLVSSSSWLSRQCKLMRDFLSTISVCFKHTSSFTRKLAQQPSINRSTYRVLKTTHHECLASPPCLDIAHIARRVKCSLVG
jgi:hypothetical protein